jgi:hypothetical protein
VSPSLFTPIPPESAIRHFSLTCHSVVSV